MAPSLKTSQRALAEVISGGADSRELIRAPDGRAPRILVCEPDAALRTRLRRVLQSSGCDVTLCGDGCAAFAALTCAPPDLVVVAAELPPIDGGAFLERVRADPATAGLPVIMLSERDAAVRGGAAAASADEVLPRSIGARGLLSRVGLHLAMARVGREASEAVRMSERRLAEVLGAIGEAVYAMDAGQRILFANRKALELWGKTADDVIGRPLLEIFPEIEDGEPYRAYCRVLQSGQPVHLETTAPALAHRWIGLDVYPAPDGGLVVAFRDIDERKRAEARLRESEERFRLMLEALPQAAFVIAADGEAEYYNQTLRDYVGAPLGTSPAARTKLHHPDDRAKLEAARAAGVKAGSEYTVEVRMRRHDGVYRWHSVRNRPVWLDGKIAFWLGTAVDVDDMRQANAVLERRVAERTAQLEASNRHLAAQIDEREKAEAQLRRAQRFEATGQLTSGIAHDFNNLLTAIIGNLDLLQTHLGQQRGERTAQLLGGAAAAAERGARLTAQLLAFSRQQQMQLEPVDLNRIVDSLGGLLDSTIGATVSIETRLAAGLWTALADPSQIELVLLNLAINARDAMPDGGVISIETANVSLGRPERPEEPPPGTYAMVSVGDTGSGIPADILDQVFEPFFTTKEVGKGSGLGLSQVLGVAQQLGGGVRIETRVGAGTSVQVFLPRAPAAEASDTHRGHAAALAAPEQSERGSALILLVDDDSDVREVAAAMLDEAGYQVVEADNGAAALASLDREGGRVGLMIADLAMPGMSGIELAQTVRLTRPDMPILFITGFVGASLPAEEAGPDKLLRKPFRAAELAARVAALLERRRDVAATG